MNLTKSDEKHKLSRMSQFIWLEELNTDTVNPYWQILENLSRNFFRNFSIHGPIPVKLMMSYSSSIWKNKSI